MKNGSFNHLAQSNNIRTDWNNTLFFKSLTRSVWKNRLLATFLKWIEQMLVTAIYRIKDNETYYRP